MAVLLPFRAKLIMLKIDRHLKGNPILYFWVTAHTAKSRKMA